MRFRVAVLPAAAAVCLIAGGCSVETAAFSGDAGFSGCSAYDTHAQAQKAWENAGKPSRYDGDGDGLACESLPGTKRSGSEGSTGGGTAKTSGCRTAKKPVAVLLSRSKYPETSLHIEDAIAHGQPSVLKIERTGTDAKRDEWQQVSGDGWDWDGDGEVEDRDEFSLAMASRSTGAGRNASVALVDPSDNRGAGSTISHQLSAYCDGTPFKIKMYNHRLQPVKILVIAEHGKKTRRVVTADS